jgi:hypothetical protein
MFDEKTKEHLKYYVYFLIDPKSNEPFYVGKGKNNRVFDHINQEIEGESESLKYQEIQRIGAQNVRHVIVRHGLSESTAYAIEASIIDIFRFIPSFDKFVKGNIQEGFNSIEKGLMSANELKSLYNAETLESIEDDCLINNINGTYKKGGGAGSIYAATKETWKMADWRPKLYKYVISEYRGLIREVFKVENWYTKNRPDKYGNLYEGWGFDGFVADELIRKKYLTKSIKEIKPRGYGSPIVYPETFRKWVKAINEKNKND